MRIAHALLVALAVPGCVLVFDDDRDEPAKPPIPTDPDVVGTTDIVPLLCSSGLPGDPSCPINYVALDEFDVSGGMFSFVVQPLDSGLDFPQFAFHGGRDGLFIDGAVLRLRSNSSGAIVEHPIGTLSVPPGKSASVEVGRVVILDTGSVLSLRARAISPYR